MGYVTAGDNLALALQAAWMITAVITFIVSACVWRESWRTWQAVVRRNVRNGRRALSLLALLTDSAMLFLMAVVAVNALLATTANVWGWPGQWAADYLRPSLLVMALFIMLCSRIHVMFGRRRLQQDGLERFDHEAADAITRQRAKS